MIALKLFHIRDSLVQNIVSLSEHLNLVCKIIETGVLFSETYVLFVIMYN